LHIHRVRESLMKSFRHTAVLAAFLSVAFIGPQAAVAAPECFGREATIVGTSGDDKIEGTPGPDVIVGKGGDDKIDGRGGNDRICAGPAGFDQVKGSAGDDRIEVEGFNPEETPVEEHYATAYGGAGDDLVRGTDFYAAITGGDGDDKLVTDSAHLVSGDDGADVLHGLPTSHQSRLSPGAGPDEIVDESDTGILVVSSAPNGVTVDLELGVLNGWGHDTVSGIMFVEGSKFDDVLKGSAAVEILEGRGGDDVLVGRAGDDHLHGSEGADRVFGGDGNDVASGTFDCTADRPGTCNAPDFVRGGPGDDQVAGGGGDDDLGGGDGADEFFGQSGDDLAHGGDGPDKLHGVTGDDMLFGDEGDDYLSGYYTTRAADAESDAGSNDSLNGGPGTDECYAGESYTECETTD
jgi:Ca2+-binding RTX toxin-like protein